MNAQLDEWPLRIGLLVALVALVATGLIVGAPGSTVRTTTLPPARTKAHPPRSATPTTVPGAFTGRVTRLHSGGECGFSLGAQVSSSSRSGTKPSTATSLPVGSCTVVEIGDSLGNDLGWGLTRHLAAASGLNMIQLDKSSTGLANSWFYNWLPHLAAALSKYHPQLVLISLGGNDEQGMELNGTAVPFGAPTWKSAFLNSVRQIVSEATASGAYVIWVGLPIMQQSSYSQGMATIDSLFQEGVAMEANATFLSTWSLFSNLQGGFGSAAAVNGLETTLREPDGIHYSFSGEDVAATYVIREMALIYHVKLAPIDPAVITRWG
jgi:hypothetical protein